MSRLARLSAMSILLTLLASGCGLVGGPSAASLSAHQLAASQNLPTGSFSSRRVVVSFSAGQADQARTQITSRMGLRVVGDLPQLGMSAMALPSGKDSAATIAAIAALPGVSAVEPDAIARCTYHPVDPQMNVGRAGTEYAAWRSEMYKAWDLTLGDPTIVVAVVDTGLDLTHPELRDHLVPGKNFVTQVELDPGDGSPAQLVAVPDQGPMDDAGHGTHVAGIIAAAENAQGVTGVAPRCKLMPVKSLAYNENGFSSDVANGILWATDHGARVINLSLGAYGGSKALERAVAYAVAHRVVVIAAMGNDHDAPDRGYGLSPSYPAALPGVIAVGAVDGQDQPAAFSNVGRWISVSAPGVGILSSTPTYMTHGLVAMNYDVMDGTSMATPFVSGVAALILSLSPELGSAEIKSRLEASADDLGVPGYDTTTGWGRINPYRALSSN